jgi:hypothetical protein
LLTWIMNAINQVTYNTNRTKMLICDQYSMLFLRCSTNSNHTISQEKTHWYSTAGLLIFTEVTYFTTVWHYRAISNYQGTKQKINAPTRTKNGHLPKTPRSIRNLVHVGNGAFTINYMKQSRTEEVELQLFHILAT